MEIKGKSKEMTKKQPFFEKKKKKGRKKKLSDLKRQVQQRRRIGGRSFSHEKTGDMFKIYCKNQYEMHSSVSPELNNNIYKEATTFNMTTLSQQR